MHISFGGSYYDTTPVGADLSFDQFVHIARSARNHGKLDAAAYAAADRATRIRDKDGRWFIAGRFVPAERRTECLRSLCGFVGDFDSGVIGRAELEKIFRGGDLSDIQFVAWTSYSHGVDRKERWRVFVPYKDVITPERHKDLYAYFNEIFQGQLDPSCAKPAQLWYLPGCPKDALPIASLFQSNEGARPFDSTIVGEAVVSVADATPAGTPPAILQGANGRDANDDLSGRVPPTLKEIVEAVAALNKDEHARHDPWVEIGMAIHHGTNGSEQGLRIWDRWSSRIAGYDPKLIVEKWRSFGGRKDGITVGTLLARARKNPGDTARSLPAAVDTSSRVQTGTANTAAFSSPRLDVAPGGPVQLALPIASITIPSGWRNDPKNFAIQKETPSEDGMSTYWKTVIDGYRLLRIDSLAAIDEGGGAVELEFQYAPGLRKVRLLSGHLGPAELGDALRHRSVFIDDISTFGKLMSSWLRKVQGELGEKGVVSSMGWVAPKGVVIGFAAGTSVYYSDGHIENDTIVLDGGDDLGTQYRPMGEYAQWQAVANFIAKQGQLPLVTILASAFAAPLVRLTGLSGALLSIVSTKSGVGKTSAMQTAQAVWGSRDAMHSTDDTPLSFSSKLGATKNLPVYWDDVKGAGTFRRLPDLVYQITQGKEKSRLDHQAKRRGTKTWDTLAAFAANDSIVEAMRANDANSGTDATVARIFELRLEEQPIGDRQSPSFFDAVRTNYGHAGEIYAKALATRHDKIKALVIQTQSGIEKELRVPPEERFWVMIVASLISGAKLAKALGIVDFDIPPLEQYLKAHLRAMRLVKEETVSASSAVEIVTDMRLDFSPETIYVEEFQKRGPAKELVIDKHPSQRGASLKAACAVTEKLYRVRRSDFSEWLRKRGFSPDTVVRQLEQMKAIRKDILYDPGAGTMYKTGTRARCHELDLAKLQLGTED